MKPLVYYDFKNLNDEEVAINKDRLKEVLEEVYQSGYNDGKNSKSTTTLTTTPWNVSDTNIAYLNNIQPREIHSTGTIPSPNVTVTCENLGGH